MKTTPQVGKTVSIKSGDGNWIAAKVQISTDKGFTTFYTIGGFIPLHAEGVLWVRGVHHSLIDEGEYHSALNSVVNQIQCLTKSQLEVELSNHQSSSFAQTIDYVTGTHGEIIGINVSNRT